MMKMLKSRVSIPSWAAGDFISSPEGLAQMEIAALSSPPDMTRDCTFLEGATPDEKAGQLADVFKSLR
jgi:electron transfer flavoprotein beta subunit